NIPDNSYTCQYCGKVVSEFTSGDYYQNPQSQEPIVDDSGAAGFGVLGFFVPLAGLILYLVWKDSRPLRAKASGKGALVSVIISVIFSVIYYIFLAAVLAQY
ncbi:MAG: hypothetical protein PHE93_05170, partial [Clostridia bacterium]|nr:hypothetical protein [Clostridia bacterium]